MFFFFFSFSSLFFKGKSTLIVVPVLNPQNRINFRLYIVGSRLKWSSLFDSLRQFSVPPNDYLERKHRNES